MIAGNSLGKELGILAVAIVLLFGTALVGTANSAYADLQLREPDPTVGATECGSVGFSSDGLGQNGIGGNIQADVPLGSTVEQAYLYASTFSDLGPTIDDFDFDGTLVDLAKLTNNEHGFLRSYIANVTTQVATKVGGGGGVTDFAINSDPFGLDGVALVVIFSNPGFPQGCVILMDGGLASTPAQTTIIGSDEIDKDVLGFEAIMALGIGFSFQASGGPTHECGASAPQFSTVDVNGDRLTSCAGNYDDGQGNDGALLTVGGVGDDELNPDDPLQTAGDGDTPRTIDDELYNIAGFIEDGDTQITLVTENTSEDDLIFMLLIGISAQTSVGEICGDGIDNDGDDLIDEGCSLPGYDLDLFEGADPSDLVLDLGQEAKAVASTEDSTVTNVTFTWIDPSSNPDQTTTVPVVAGSAEDTFTPDEVGTWTVVADFGNGVVVVKQLDIDFLVIPESAFGTLVLVVSSLAAMGAFYGIRIRSRGKM